MSGNSIGNEKDNDTIVHDLKALIHNNALIASQVLERIFKIQSVHIQHEKSTMLYGDPSHLPINIWPAILDRSPVCLIEINSVPLDDPIIVWAGRMITDALGYFPGELQYKPVSILIPEALTELYRSHAKSFQIHPKDVVIGEGHDLFLRRKVGDVVPVRVYLATFGCEGRLFTSATIMFVPSGDHVADDERSRQWISASHMRIEDAKP